MKLVYPAETYTRRIDVISLQPDRHNRRETPIHLKMTTKTKKLSSTNRSAKSMTALRRSRLCQVAAAVAPHIAELSSPQTAAAASLQSLHAGEVSAKSAIKNTKTNRKNAVNAKQNKVKIVANKLRDLLATLGGS